ncbi:MAG: adenylosuccinate synthetase [Patescibacteria group bacterium]|jgi:adenylosuccinate synthase
MRKFRAFSWQDDLIVWNGVLVVVGVQWGDEGKGKIVDHLARSAEVIIRYSGGANAGHTIVIDGIKYVSRLIPSAYHHPGKIVACGPGTALDLDVLNEEVPNALRAGSTPLFDENAPIVISLYKQIDEINEKKSGKTAIGTTRRGIGPCMGEFVGNRRGLRMGDLKSEERIRAALMARNFYPDLADEIRRGGLEPMSFEGLVSWCLERGKVLGEYIGDVRCLVQELLHSNAPILCEGAQGGGLGIYGTWPYVTSTDPMMSGAIETLGLPRRKIAGCLGITKAYTTRVGEGPFPTKMNNEWSQRIQVEGGEAGTVTGRLRDVGGLDGPYLRYICDQGDVDYLVMNKLDPLTGDKIPFCTGYVYKGTKRYVERYTTLNTELLESIEPDITYMEGWSEPISNCRHYDDLPKQARDYVECVERFVGVPIIGVGVGPGRDALIWRKTSALLEPEG